MVCPLNAAFNRAAAYASLDQPRLMRPSHAVGSCIQMHVLRAGAVECLGPVKCSR